MESKTPAGGERQAVEARRPVAWLTRRRPAGVRIQRGGEGPDDKAIESRSSDGGRPPRPTGAGLRQRARIRRPQRHGGSAWAASTRSCSPLRRTTWQPSATKASPPTARRGCPRDRAEEGCSEKDRRTLWGEKRRRREEGKSRKMMRQQDGRERRETTRKGVPRGGPEWLNRHSRFDE